jgi:hypothetical protein
LRVTISSFSIVAAGPVGSASSRCAQARSRNGIRMNADAVRLMRNFIVLSPCLGVAVISIETSWTFVSCQHRLHRGRRPILLVHPRSDPMPFSARGQLSFG